MAAINNIVGRLDNDSSSLNGNTLSAKLRTFPRADSDHSAVVPDKSDGSTLSITDTLSSVLSISTATGSLSTPPYRVYPQRWALLLTVVILNVANFAHWIAFASVSSKAAIFYDVSVEKLQLILTVSYGLGVPCCCVATFVMSHFGMATGLWTGAVCTFVGGGMCCVSTLPPVVAALDRQSIFILTLLGQALTGIGCPFISCVPTKVSQHWFGERERPLATTLLGLAQPVGLVAGQALTPLFVSAPEHLPVMNIVWFMPALVGMILTTLTVTRSRPPTPPSRSAAIEAAILLVQHDERQPLGTRARLVLGLAAFKKTVVSIMTNWSYLILMIVIGGAMGFLSTLQIKNEPMLCAKGYSNWFSGLSAAMVFVGGIIGATLLGTLLSWISEKSVLCSKVLCVPLAATMVLQVFVLRTSGVDWAVAVDYFLLGFFAIGMYPTLLEFAVECTYPNDEAVLTAIIMVSSCIQGLAMVQLDDVLSPPLQEHLQAMATCSPQDGIVARNHDVFVAFLNGYGLLLLIIYLVFFNTKLKRTEANKAAEKEDISGVVLTHL